MDLPGRTLRRSSALGRSKGPLTEIRVYLYHLLEDFDERESWSSPVKMCVASGMTVMILVSLVCLVLETEPGLANTPPEVWNVVEAVTTCSFTLEYVLRLWVCDVYGLSMLAWALRPINVCDLLSIVPFYAEFVVSSDISWLRVLRVIRLAKLGRYSQGVQVMAMALANSMQALYILIFIFLMGMVIFASTVYFTEKFSCPEFGGDKALGLAEFLLYNEECDPTTGDGTGTSPTFGTCCAYQCRFLPSPTPGLCQYAWEDSLSGLSRHGRRLQNTTAGAGSWEVVPLHELAFSSVFTAMWWACATMSTVGYGDIVPKNWISKCVASVAMIAGMLIIAMPFAIVGAKFGEAVAVCEAGDARHAAAARLKKVRQFGGVQQIKRSQSQTSVGEQDLMNFEALQEALSESMALKQEIMRVQQLRDNLWTSVEHAMANFTLEGIQSLGEEVLKDNEEGGAADGVDPRLCEWSCYVFHRDSLVRRTAIRIARSTAFEYLVLSAILTNSVIMANLDHYPRKVLPWENMVYERTEIAFIILFTCECIVKVVARGFILDRNSYLRDAWNWIDFVVVITGLVLMIAEASLGTSGSQPDLAVLRVLRVLRPLRTLSVLPGLRKLVRTILSSLPGLKDVVLMSFFLLAIFGILGLQLYGGVMHRRCRVTPQPLHFTQRALEPTCSGWCFDNSSLVNVDLGSGHRSSPLDAALVFGAFCGKVPACTQAFNEGGDYYVWPVDPSQDRFCGEYKCKAVSFDALAGFTVSGTNASKLAVQVLEPLGAIEDGRNGRQVRTTCGSPFDHDTFYAPGVANAELKGVNLDSPEAEVTSSSFNWGLTHYDQIGGASLVVFQCATLEGWVDIMYMLQDAYSGPLGFFYFFLLIIIGYFFLLNIILAIVYDAFCAADVSQRHSLMEDAISPNTGLDSTCPSGLDSVPVEAMQLEGDAKGMAANVSVTELLKDLDVTDDIRTLAEKRPRRGWAAMKEDFLYAWLQLLRRSPPPSVDALLREQASWRIRNCARWVASSVIFDSCVMFVISANVVVLSLDRFPTNMLFERSVCEDLNRVCNIMFICEFLILHVAVGPLAYWCDNALAFDGIIVLLSLPDEILSLSGGSSSASLQAIRAFRLLRIFKLAKKFPSMKVLLKACIETLKCMSEFVLLLAIVVCVFALIGQNFFGGKFLFDPVDGSVIPKEEFESRCPFSDGGRGKPECVPRAHFDTFLWSVVTIFQILTGENWNNVMYDGMRATEWYAVFFFVSVIVIGQFVILNLCLSMLMMNFECHRSNMANIEKEKKRRTQQARKERVSAILKSMTDNAQASSRRQHDHTDQDQPQIVGQDTSSGSVAAFDQQSRKSVRATTKSRKRQFFAMFTHRDRSKSCPALPGTPDLDDELQREVRMAQVVPEDFARPTHLLPGDMAQSSAWVEQQADGSAGDLQIENVSNHTPGMGSCFVGPLADSVNTGDESLVIRREVVYPDGSSDAAPDDPEIESVGDADPATAKSAGSMIAKYVTTQVGRMTMRQGTRVEAEDVPSLERLVPPAIQKTKHFGSLRRRSCFIFDDAHPLRHLCLYLAKDSRFDQVIISLITISSALMMLQNPLHDPGGTKEVVLGWANVAFTIVFAMEMVIKMTAFGMFCGQPGRPAYLQSSWNILDAFIVTVSLADVLQNHLTADKGGVLGFMKVFRIARVLRPLRLISRNENLKVVVKTIAASLPELRNLSVFSSLFFLIFALLGVSNLKGSFYRCLDHKLTDYPFEQLRGVTPLCVPPVASAQARSADIDLAMRFTRQEAPGGGQQACPASWMPWERLTADTPICEVHCSSEASHPFCSRAGRPWGYHTMRCTDCSEEFCPGARADLEHANSCRDLCERHQYFCQDTSDPNRPACIEQCIAECLCPDHCGGLTKDAALCAEQGGRWVNMNQNFDNLGMGMISLFEICTTEGWVDVMIAAADFRGPYLQPRRDSTELFACSLSVAFILIGSFFVLNLCVGVIIDNYHRQKEGRGRLLVTPAQNSWIIYQKALYAKRSFFVQTNMQQLPPTRKHLIRIVTSSRFENVIMACIIMNTIVLGMVQYPRPSDTYSSVLDRLNLVFALIFNIEAAMKLCAMRLAYFKERWNVFDFTCVFVTDAFLVIEAVVDGSPVQIAGVMQGVRVFRIARLFRLVRFLKGLNQLTMAFILSVPKLANVAFIMLLLIYLFAVLGVNLFAEVEYIDGGSYNDNANFRTFWQALSVLIRSMTGEGWNYIMHALAKDRFYYETYLDVRCVEGLTVTAANFHTLDIDGDGVVDPEFINGCGKKVLAFTYFITYTLIVTFVILNLFIAVIFEGFEESSKSQVSDVLEKCTTAWRRYDPNNTMVISLDNALDFIDEVVDQLCQHQADQDDPHLTMGSRWDPSYSGMRSDIQPLALYSLRYMRIIDLRVTPSNEVRFIVAVKGVIRRLVVQGSHAGAGCTSNATQMERLAELEHLERLMTSSDIPQGLDKELVNLRRQQQRQARAINTSLKFQKNHPMATMTTMFPRMKSTRSMRSNASDNASQDGDERFEYLLLQEVAAAKIQRRVKEAFQRRRARLRSTKLTTRPTYLPIARAAG